MQIMTACKLTMKGPQWIWVNLSLPPHLSRRIKGRFLLFFLIVIKILKLKVTMRERQQRPWYQIWISSTPRNCVMCIKVGANKLAMTLPCCVNCSFFHFTEWKTQNTFKKYHNTCCVFVSLICWFFCCRSSTTLKPWSETSARSSFLISASGTSWNSKRWEAVYKHTSTNDLTN